MQQAAGMYNTLLQSDDAALVIECLNGYRSKERMPANLGEFTVPIGEAEVVREGTDLTLVSYGSTFNICAKACERLEASASAWNWWMCAPSSPSTASTVLWRA
jgi:pyruvate/2-oxoglutarate/acetoin dehydrogenase E1 component